MCVCALVLFLFFLRMHARSNVMFRSVKVPAPFAISDEKTPDGRLLQSDGNRISQAHQTIASLELNFCAQAAITLKLKKN